VLRHSLDLRLLGHLLNASAALGLAAVIAGWTIETFMVGSLRQDLKEVNVMSVFATTVAIGVGLFFVASGLGKLVAVGAFRRALENTYGLSSHVSTAAGPAIIALELTCAVLLILPETRSLGLLAGGTLVSGFVLSAIGALVSGGSGDCGCLGVIRGEPLGVMTVVRGVVILAALAGAALVSLRPVKSFDPVLDPPAVALLAIPMAISVAVLATVSAFNLFGIHRRISRDPQRSP